ncbi:dimethylaniline monooxygenase [Colletotrichum tofieldiae]|nr:dimethylaniline monooxygenase [Colletotrichum tofieldiae]
MKPAKRVAVIGLGPAGAITIDALAQEKAFDTIRVFERREAPGGCCLPYLETNVDFVPMQYTQEPFPTTQTALSRALHGEDTPFRHWSYVQDYVRSLVERRGYQDLVSYNTTVERAEKVSSTATGAEEWKLTLRKEDPATATETWWEERFDALVVASGHYAVPYIPSVPGLPEFAAARPGSVIHSKHFRGRDAYAGKKVVVVGASVSAADIAYDLTSVASPPVTAVVVGHTVNGYFGGEAFEHPLIAKVPSIARVEPETRMVHFVDGTSASGVDAIIFGTGPRNNRIPNLYLHTVYTPDPTILFVGAVNAGLTFKIFEYQAVLAARLLAGRVPPHRLPSAEAQLAWEADRVAKRGDGAKFALVFPDFEEYFETVRNLAGPPTEDGKGRELPPFNSFWFERFMKGHERRKAMWKRLNAEAREALGAQHEDGKRNTVRAKL